ncbi:JAB domain-containing protein [Brevibacillus reuszeri]|uniref:JAB domain-containing protein n=1 Tax=Brevibacillus reuszeri TaxID=54915 RepID=UPI003D24E1C5
MNSSLSPILAQLLREKPSSYKINELCKRFPTLHDLLDATEEELTSIPGIGKVKARQLILALESACSIDFSVIQKLTYCTAEDIFLLLKVEMQYLPKEHFVVIGLNAKHQILFHQVVSIGSLDAAIIHPREAYRPILKRNAQGVIFAHNHPSGNATPSREDIEVTKKLIHVGEIIGIQVHDHIVIGFESYCSLKEEGWFEMGEYR